jgi:hypothetical protein
MADQHRWVRYPPNQWWLVDDRDLVVRQIARHQYLGQPNPYFRVTGGDGYTDHPTLEEAMDAAEATVR